MRIITISGSTRSTSSNSKLLEAIILLFPNLDILQYDQLDELPIFKAENDSHPWHETVLNWRSTLKNSDAVIISIPEYIHNIPALIKNALEWITSSGELVGKPVLAITFTPHKPRGEKAMQSLCWSLQALDARIVAQLPLYQNEINFQSDGFISEGENLEMLKEAVKLLGSF